MSLARLLHKVFWRLAVCTVRKGTGSQSVVICVCKYPGKSWQQFYKVLLKLLVMPTAIGSSQRYSIATPSLIVLRVCVFRHSGMAKLCLYSSREFFCEDETILYQFNAFFQRFGSIHLKAWRSKRDLKEPGVQQKNSGPYRIMPGVIRLRQLRWNLMGEVLIKAKCQSAVQSVVSLHRDWPIMEL